MYAISVKQLPRYPPDVFEQLSRRCVKSVEETLNLVAAFEAVHRSFPFQASQTKERVAGVYYLDKISECGVRKYSKHHRAQAVNACHVGSNVVKIELMEEAMSPELLIQILSSMQEGCAHVFSSGCENFSVGASAGGKMDMEEFVMGTSRLVDFITELQPLCTLPVVTVCHRAARGGGMLFPALSDVVIATEDATFGFPEVRRGVLPGVVSVAARQRLSKSQCRHWMLLGNSFDAQSALRLGWVDFVGTQEEVEAEVESVIQQLNQCLSAKLDGGLGELSTALSTELVTTTWPLERVAEIALSQDHASASDAVHQLKLLLTEIGGFARAVVLHSSWANLNLNNTDDVSLITACTSEMLRVPAPILMVISGPVTLLEQLLQRRQIGECVHQKQH